MWPVLAFLALLVALALEIVWRRRWRVAQAELQELREAQATLEQDRSRRAAREQARHEALFDRMGEGVLLLDTAGRVTWANESLRRMFGLPNDLAGQTLLEALRIEQLLALVERLARQPSIVGHELCLPGVDRRCFQVNAARVPGPEPASEGTLLVFHEVTRLKELERTRQEFVANVSHELRTPLSLIKGGVETLLDGAKDDPAAARRFLQMIEKHADRLADLIEDLLTISRLESGQLVLNLQPTELRTLATRVLDDLATPAATRQVRLENQVPPDLTAHADPERLEQVLFNLVDNAIKYGRAGGQVLVGARPRPAAGVEVWVRDDGPGIPPAAKDRVFERFYRVDQSRSREQGGTGLGLAIVKHIVQSHGGEVRVESELGQGATFYFVLPG